MRDVPAKHGGYTGPVLGLNIVRTVALLLL